MKKLLLPLALATMTHNASALDLNALSDSERADFQKEVRAYILSHPEVLIEAFDILEARQNAAQEQNDVNLVAQNKDALFNDQNSWVGGNLEGDVTLVEFVDYQCGYCKRAFSEIKELIATDGNIRLVMKEFPILGDASLLSARFAIATLQTTGDDAYRQVHDALMTFRGNITHESLENLATRLGLDPAPILAAMDSDKVSDVIAQNHALARNMGISGTPTFVLDDKMLRGYVPLDGMYELVAQAREN